MVCVGMALVAACCIVCVKVVIARSKSGGSKMVGFRSSDWSRYDLKSGQFARL